MGGRKSAAPRRSLAPRARTPMTVRMVQPSSRAASSTVNPLGWSRKRISRHCRESWSPRAIAPPGVSTKDNTFSVDGRVSRKCDRGGQSFVRDSSACLVPRPDADPGAVNDNEGPLQLAFGNLCYEPLDCGLSFFNCRGPDAEPHNTVV